MSRRAFWLLISSVACLFAIVWGGGYLWLQSSREKERVAKVEKEETERRAESDRQAAADKAHQDREDQERQEAKDKESKAATAKNRDAQKTKAAQQDADRKAKKIALFTHAERVLHDQMPQLKTKHAKDAFGHQASDYLVFAIRHRELYPDINIREKVIEHAKDMGIEQVFARQGISDEKLKDELTLDYGLLSYDLQRLVFYTSKTTNVKDLDDQGKITVRSRPKYFPKLAGN